MQNWPRILKNSLPYAAVVMLSVIPDFTPDNGRLSLETRPPGWEVGVLQTTRQS